MSLEIQQTPLDLAAIGWVCQSCPLHYEPCQFRFAATTKLQRMSSFSLAFFRLRGNPKIMRTPERCCQKVCFFVFCFISTLSRSVREKIKY